MGDMSPLCGNEAAERETAMSEKLVVGRHLIFVDEHMQERDALLTAIHGDPEGRLCLGAKVDDDGKQVVDDEGILVAEYGEPGASWPCLNMVVISDNDKAQDQYGRQLDERPSSVVHWTNSSANGYCWRFPEETIDRSTKERTIS